MSGIEGEPGNGGFISFFDRLDRAIQASKIQNLAERQRVAKELKRESLLDPHHYKARLEMRSMFEQEGIDIFAEDPDKLTDVQKSTRTYFLEREKVLNDPNASPFLDE